MKYTTKAMHKLIVSLILLVSVTVGLVSSSAMQICPEGVIAAIENTKDAVMEDISSESVISEIELIANTKAINSGVVMKIGSDYMLYKGSKAAIYTDTDGKTYGAPFKAENTVYTPLKHIARLAGRYAALDDVTFDLSYGDRSITLVVGSKEAVINGERVELKHTPYYEASDLGSKFVVISIEDVNTIYPSLFVTYDEMGLFAVTNAEKVFDREKDLSAMITLMKKFIFDNRSAEDLYSMIEENTDGFDHPYLLADDEQFDYLNKTYEATLAKKEKREYDEEYVDETLFEMLMRTINSANSSVDVYTTLPKEPANYTFRQYAYERDPEKYKLLAFEITNPYYGIKDGEVYTDNKNYDYTGPADENGDYWGKLGEHYNDGYDYAGGRCNLITNYTMVLRNLALAYRITLDRDYAELAYDVAISLCDNNNWHNWAHAHYLNTAQVLQDFALAYDWCYDIWGEIELNRASEYSRDSIAQAMYRKGIYYGYMVCRHSIATLDSTRKQDSDGSSAGNNWNWSKAEINWNAVCAAGLVTAAMAIVGEKGDVIDYVDPVVQRPTDVNTNRVMWTLENNIKNLANYGLVQYAPDGSYIEGPGYWGYATNNLAILLWAINTAVGDDLGFFETWGIVETFYFAVNVEYQDEIGYRFWSFHDAGSTSSIDSSLFLFAAEMAKDESLAAIRLDQLKKGKKASFTDFLAYKPEYKDLSMENVTLDKDYVFEACDGVVTRGDWNEGALFAGLMGNENDCTAHGQMDSGNFIYANKDYTWFVDLGADEYNVYGYFGYGYSGVRMRYYRNSAEGHNVVCMTSRQDDLIHGQNYYDGGKLVEFVSEEDGMYAIVDNAGAYGSYVEYARRGLLVTNSRYTTVIQDEMKFKSPESVVWIGHTAASITISNDGKAAYLKKYINGKFVCLRATLLSDDKNLKFSTMGAGVSSNDFLLDATIRPGWSESKGGLQEYSRSSYRRLVVKANNVLEFNVAVVLEIVGAGNEEAKTRYTMQEMSQWTISAGDGKLEEDLPFSKDYSQQYSDIIYYSKTADRYIDEGLAFGTRYTEFYTSLYKVFIAVKQMGSAYLNNNEEAKTAYNEKYVSALAIFNTYRNSVNGVVDNNLGLLNSSSLLYKNR